MDYSVILLGVTISSIFVNAMFFKIYLQKNKLNNEILLKNQNLIITSFNQMKNYHTIVLSELEKHSQQNEIKVANAVIDLKDILNKKHTNLHLLLNTNNDLLNIAIKNTTDDLKKDIHRVYSGSETNNNTLNKKIDNITQNINDLAKLEEIL